MMLIVIGEVFNLVFDCNKLIECELIDFICFVVIYGGGIMLVKCIVDLVGLYYVCIGFYGVLSYLFILMVV